MCGVNEHDFAVLSVSDKEMCTAEEDKIAYYNPASLFCKKCGFICHVQANVHSSKRRRKREVDIEELKERVRNDWYSYVIEHPGEPIPPYPFKEEEYFDPVERVFKR